MALRRAFVSWGVAVCTVAGAGTAGAQTAAPLPAIPAVAQAPVNVILPNYNGVPAGETGSLEGGAFLVRANDSSSAFYNPAGLALAEQSSVSGSAGVFQSDSVTPENFLKTGGSFQQIPAMVAVIVKDLFHDKRWSGGGGIARVNAWNQSSAAERLITVGNTSERVTYLSAAQFSSWIMNLGAGYTNGKNLRVGGSLDVQYTSSQRSQSLADQLQTSSGLNALLVGANGWATAAHLRMTIGTQYDISPTLHVGAVFRTSGLTLFKSGSYTLEGQSHVGSVTTSASFFDDAGTVEYKIPLEFRTGAAYVGRRAQLEVDVLAHRGAGVYAGFQSSQLLTVVTDPGLGAAPTVQAGPFTPAIIDSTSVVNVVVGGRVNLSTSGTWRLHAGFGTDRSPVGPSDTTFTPIDLQNWTVGFSGRTKFIVSSVGLRTETGTSGLVPLRSLMNGDLLQTRFKVRNVGLVYSVAVLF